MNKSKQLITMATLIVLFLGGTFWGFQLLTSEASPVSTPAPTCKDHTVKPGEKLTTNLVRVNVYNTSQRSGLANRVHINLQRRGFLAGEIGNSPDGVKARTVTIVTKDRQSSPVRLVAKQFKNKVKYTAPKSPLEDGVTIIVGDDFAGLRKNPARSVKAKQDLTVCVPIVQAPGPK